MAFEWCCAGRLGDLLWPFHCTRVNERGQNAAIVEVLARKVWLEKYMQGS